MTKVIAYIGRFNLYYSLRDLGWKRFYWLNLRELAEQFLGTEQVLFGNQVLHNNRQKTG